MGGVLAGVVTGISWSVGAMGGAGGAGAGSGKAGVVSGMGVSSGMVRAGSMAVAGVPWSPSPRITARPSTGTGTIEIS